MKLLVDMNLSPDWIPWLAQAGVDSVHWSTVGAADAPDEELMNYAVVNSLVLFTHDLDFGDLLAASKASKPSVIQVRSQDTFPDAIGPVVLDALRRFATELQSGALVVVEPGRGRVRLLPIN
jgi:predicted nuclease of predicted toxin-antitoxin system